MMEGHLLRASFEVEEEGGRDDIESQARVNQYVLNEVAKLKNEVRRLQSEVGLLKRTAAASGNGNDDVPLRRSTSYVYTVNAHDGTIITFSSSLAELLNIGVECAVGSRIDALLAPDFVGRTHALLRERRNGLLEQLYSNHLPTLDEVFFSPGSSVATIKVRPCRATNEVRGSELIKTHELVELVTHLEVVASRLAQRPDGSAPWSAAQWHERTRGLLGESQSWAEQPEASRDYFEALAQAEAGVAQSEGQRAKLARITDRLMAAVKTVLRDCQQQAGSLEMLRDSVHKVADLLADRESSVEPQLKKRNKESE